MSYKGFCIKIKTDTGFEQMMPRTAASCVIEEPDRRFVTDAEKEKLNQTGAGPERISFSLPVSAWQGTMRYAKYPYEASIAIPGLSSVDSVSVVLDPPSAILAGESGVLSSNLSESDAVKLFAGSQPTGVLQGRCEVVKGVE